MKLSLDKKNLTCMTLTVTESVTEHDAKVLRLGFKKLLGTARNSFFIDISGAVLAPQAEMGIHECQIDALINKIRLVVIGANPRICQAPNMKEAQALVGAVVRLDKVLVPQLYALHKYLAVRKDAAEKKLNSPVLQDQPDYIIGENNRLRLLVSSYESMIDILQTDHKEPEPLGPLANEKTAIERKILAELNNRQIPV